MTKYIMKKMATDWKETIGNTIFVSCLMAVLIVCCHVIAKIREMTETGWYKNGLEVASIGDPFVREKLEAILQLLLVLIGVLMVFCLVLYALKVKLDIVKERQRISVFQVLGYTTFQRIGALYFWKSTELLAATGLGGVLAIGIWKQLCNQKMFLTILTLMNKDMNYQWKFCLWMMVFLAVWGLAVICRVMKKKTNIAEVLKGAENE